MMDAIQTELISLLFAVIVTCVGFITKSFTGYIKKKGVIKDIENNKEVARIVVNAIEQLYTELDGKGKLKVAKTELVKALNSKKIKIDEQEINLLIESVVKEMNDKYKENK